MRTAARTVTVVGVAALGAVLSAPAPAAAARKPHLVVTRASAGGPRYAFRGHVATFSFKHTTKNVGGATSERSRTGLVLDAIGHPRRFIVIRGVRVVKLKPGHSDRGGLSVVTLPTGGQALGAYRLMVCPDLARARVNRDCRSAGRRFYIAAGHWEGSLRGAAGSGGIANLEHWSGSPTFLTFDKYLGQGAFRYIFNGTVKWTDDGIGGCVWTGSGTELVDDANSRGGIVLNYATGRYEGKQSLTRRFYTIALTGGGGIPCNDTAPGPVLLNFLTISRHHLGFAQFRLTGRTGAAGGEAPAWAWDFKTE